MGMMFSMLPTRLLMPIVRANRWVLLSALACLMVLIPCFSEPGFTQPNVQVCLQPSIDASLTDSASDISLLSLPSVTSPETLEVLQQSWLAYRDRFIQTDGRVIDREMDDRTVSEGQAYAMLRAVLINDADTFARTLTWAENNLSRKNDKGERTDALWAWKWGRQANGEWQTIDANFASDADVDAAVALILAARRWNCPAYADLAHDKLKDLWKLSTIKVKGKRYLLPGPDESFRQAKDLVVLNPSYFAPYAFRLFDQIDRRNWSRLVDTSYSALEESASLSAVGLPGDWIALNRKTGKFEPVQETETLRSSYGFDAYRVWWRIAWDLAWYGESRAEEYLSQHLSHLQQRWQSTQTIPARISLQGEALVDYEATSQYAMLYYALRLIDRPVAEQIYQQKLEPVYRDGFWDSDTAYYTQNLAWFGLLPFTVPEDLMQAQSRCINFLGSIPNYLLEEPALSHSQGNTGGLFSCRSLS
jgi:endoglucanase